MGWLPGAIVGGGWALAWLLSFALASSAWVEDMLSAIVLALTGWLVAAPLVAAALRWATPDASARRLLLIAAGWPLCLAVGLAAPIALKMDYEGAALLGIGVAAAGLLGAVATTSADRPLPWERVLVVAAGWCAGWLWSGAAAWPLAFWRFTHGYASTFADLVGDVGFVALAAGGVMSGIAGALLIATVLRPRPLAG